MYQLRQPAEELSAHIESYWFVTSSEDAPVDLRVDVFVDGRSDLIFNFGAAYEREVIGGERRVIAASNLDAQRLRPIRITQRGAVRTTGVRFRLGGLGAFATIPLRTITDETPPPAEVLGPTALELEAALREETDLDAQARLLDAHFLACRHREPSFRQFERALATCIDTTGAASLADLASAAAVSTRQVERLFARYLGCPPKTLARILRFQHALRSLMQDPGTTLADVAMAAGYFDQAHFIKDFRRMSGGVPRGYRGYYPPQGPADFAPNVVVFLQDDDPGADFDELDEIDEPYEATPDDRPT
ncbi:MAG: helix-turn-helix domain-containing protein [Polyangiaceae bacterium]